MNLELKRASWLELFYDVAFVALVAQLTYLAYEHHHSITDILSIFVIGYAIFIAWWATTANRNLLPKETTTDKILVQLQMVGAFLMSLTMPAVFNGDYLAFYATFALVRLVQAGMVGRLYYLYPDTRPKTYNILQGFLVAGLLWLLSALAPAPYHYVLAFMALIIDILIPLTRGKGNTKRYLNVFHLQERLGLFLMLVIGESMIVVALSNTSIDKGVDPAIVLSGLGMMIALWWLYFEHSDSHSGVRPNNLFLFLHAHGFLFGSIILISVGYKMIIAGIESLPAFVFITMGMFGVTMTLTLIRIALHGTTKKALILTLVLSLPALAIAGYGFMTGNVIMATVLYTIWYLLAAFLDHQGLFRRVNPKELAHLSKAS